jgi:hypothetical protein
LWIVIDQLGSRIRSLQIRPISTQNTLDVGAKTGISRFVGSTGKNHQVVDDLIACPTMSPAPVGRMISTIYSVDGRIPTSRTRYHIMPVAFSPNYGDSDVGLPKSAKKD